MAGKNEVSVIIRAKDATASALKSFRQRFKATARVVKDASVKLAAFTAAAVLAVTTLTKLGQIGDKVNAVKATFAKLTGDEAGALERLRKASRGSISDFELMTRHNQALALGAADTTEQFAEMVRISRVLGRAQGIEATAALESLTTGLGRQSKLFLDNLGIIIDTEKVYEAYAKRLGKTAEQLTDNEKRTAFLAAAMEQARRKAADLAAGTDETTGAGQRLATAFANARNKLATFVAESPTVAAFLDELTGIVQGIADALNQQDWGALADIFGAVGRMMGDAFIFGFKKAIEEMPESTSFDRPFEEMLRAMGLDIDRVKKFWKENFMTQRDVFSAGTFEEAMAPSQARLDAILARLGVEGRGAHMGGPLPPLTPPGAGAGTGTGGPSSIEELGAMFAPARAFGRRIALLQRVSPLGVPIALRPRRDEFSRDVSEFRAAGAFEPTLFDLDPITAGGPLPRTRSGLGFGTGGLDLSGASQEFAQAGQIAVASLGAMAAAAIRGSDQVATSVIGMITSIAQAIPDVGGFGSALIGAVGGIFGAFFSRNEPTRVRVDDIDDRAARKIAEANAQRPLHITTNVIGADGQIETVERKLFERQNRDEVVRFGQDARPLRP